MAPHRKRIERGVYQIRNLINGRLYVGSSEDLKDRWRVHRQCLRDGNHGSKLLLEDYRKYGLEGFAFETLEPGGDVADLYDREQFWLDKLQPFIPNGYNTHTDARSGKGVKRSEETCRAISNGRKGIRFTEEHKARIAAAPGKGCIERGSAISAGRKASARAKAAIEAHNATKRKLSDGDVRRIRKLHEGGAMPRALSAEFGVSRRVIRAILSGETYQGVR